MELKSSLRILSSYKKSKGVMEIIFKIFHVVLVFMVGILVFRSYVNGFLISATFSLFYCVLNLLIPFYQKRRKEYFNNELIISKKKLGFDSVTIKSLLISLGLMLFIHITNGIQYSDKGEDVILTAYKTHKSKGLEYLQLKNEEYNLAYPVPRKYENIDIINKQFLVELRAGLFGLVAIKRVKLIDAS
ncbi:hypothetical protein [Endozoicomonas lisbonensis]|uniref:DUF5673 domain-containing protein n=1 Tax=Endozoicomonas lisbonensis TaxID=3120522 RepID=A0ABV2SE44_9GAMM